MKVLDLGSYFSISANIVSRVVMSDSQEGHKHLQNLHSSLNRMHTKDLIGCVLVLASCVAGNPSALQMFKEVVVVKDPL